MPRQQSIAAGVVPQSSWHLKPAAPASVCLKFSAVPPPASAPPVLVVSNLGAGDAFAAGFLRGVSLGRPLDESARLGNAAGALCTTRISHRGIASLEQVRRLIEDQR